MKINYKVLKSIKAQDSEVKRFIETFGFIQKEGSQKIIINTDDFNWVVSKINLKNVIIRFEDIGGWIEKQYINGNLVRYEKSAGY